MYPHWQKLFDEWEPKVSMLVKAHKKRMRISRTIRTEDMAQTASMRLLKAARTFNPGRGEFTPRAIHAIEMGVKDHLRCDSFQTRKYLRKSHKLTCDFEECVDHRCNGQAQFFERDSFRSRLDGLDRQGQMFMRAHYEDGLTLEQSSTALGFHKSYGTRIHRRCLEELRVIAERN